MHSDDRPEDITEAALEYHRVPRPGKLAIMATKSMDSQRDLSLAYSPGVAAACEAIAQDPLEAGNLSTRQNLVGVITNGTAVLGLGAIGALASKPVMEGKAVLFKKFADIDVFDIEVDELDVEEFVKTVARLEPTFGGINLEDIKAPECFQIEQALREKMKIPVFHDDQHGTAIIVCAGILNALQVVGKNIKQCKLVTSGSGAAALACLNLLVGMGLRKDNITVTDIEGVVYKGRVKHMDPWKEAYAIETDARSLDDVIEDADVFLGLSAAGVLKPEMLSKMATQPIVFALANPNPEIMPDVAKETRKDVIMATGRSDFPNQVNNVLCFPFIFRGALDAGATAINEEMKIACVKAISQLAMAEPAERVARVYGEQALQFGPDYLIPKPFDPRLIIHIAPAVAQAAADTGVASRPIADIQGYKDRLSEFVYRSRSMMRPIIEKAKRVPKRLAYAEGEERRVLQAVQEVVDEGIARPILVGRPKIINQRIKELGLSLQAGRDFDTVNSVDDGRFEAYGELFHRIARRHGVSRLEAQSLVRSKPTVIASLMVKNGDADGVICGTVGRFNSHLQWVKRIIGKGRGVYDFSTVTALILPRGNLFICDSHITPDPCADEIVEMTLLAAKEVRAFGLVPKVALLSRSSFGNSDSPSSLKMRDALAKLHERAPDLEVEGEMQGDAAMSERLRKEIFGESRLKGRANLLIMPNGDAAHIAYSLLKVRGGGITVGPILIGCDKPAHVLTETATVRGLVNMTAVTVAQAQLGDKRTTNSSQRNYHS